LNKRTFSLLAGLILLAALIASCVSAPASTPTPATTAPAVEATTVPAAAATVVVTATVPAAAQAVTGTQAISGTAAPAVTRVPVPAPQGDTRPLAKIPAAQRADHFSGPAPMSIVTGTIYIATIVTSKGNIVAELYPDTPLSVNNFVTLSQDGFYDGLTFHRVEAGFVIQGGDPKGDGSGGPGYTIPAEIKHNHPRGALAWARTGDEVNPERRSSGSQFYITLGDASFLNGAYTSFGYVIQGMDVADKIAVGDVIQRIDISKATASQLPTPTTTPTPAAPVPADGRPLATVALDKRGAIYNMPPKITIDPKKTYQATINSTKGDIVIDLDATKAITAVNNFVVLANLGFYDAMPVAHVQPSQAASQGQAAVAGYIVMGSPASAPSSDIGYSLPVEPGASSTQVITGSVAYYPSPQQNLASGSQFFITFGQMPQASTPLAVFGIVTSGMDVANKFQPGDVINKITITEK
jgi:cyclophilin family peptidyl-prolyl cis-trans isomerase